MNPRHRVSRAAIELIARFEGYRRKAAQLPDGGWTIGYGHTLTAREGAEVSEDDAEALLLYDLIAVAHGINEWTYAPLTQNQFDALASFVFNIGSENFRRSTVLKRLNEGAPIQAACAMELWRKAEFGGERIVIDALVRRRAAEKALFLTPPDGWPAAPTPVLKPLLDTDTLGVVPAEPPAPVTASLEGEIVQVLRADEPTPTPLPPEQDDETLSPVQAAAEAVAARLQSVFAEPDSEGKSEIEPAEPPGAAESTDGSATTEEAASPTEASRSTLVGPAFQLRAPEENAEAPSTRWRGEPPEEPEGQPSGDLFAANDATAEAEPAPQPGAPRMLIDDTAPFEFTPPIVQPLPTQPKAGVLSLVTLAVLGLAFLGGGLFWALNARPGAIGGLMTPLTVGWLAGLAGVGFFSVAVFLLLQRIARGSGDDDRG